MDKQIELIERNLDVTRVGCKFSRVKSIERQSYRGRAARVIASGKVGHSSTTDGLSDDQLIDRATASAQVNVPATLAFPGQLSTSDQAHAAVDALTESDLRDWTRHAVLSGDNTVKVFEFDETTITSGPLFSSRHPSTYFFRIQILNP